MPNANGKRLTAERVRLHQDPHAVHGHHHTCSQSTGQRFRRDGQVRNNVEMEGHKHSLQSSAGGLTFPPLSLLVEQPAAGLVPGPAEQTRCAGLSPLSSRPGPRVHRLGVARADEPPARVRHRIAARTLGNCRAPIAVYWRYERYMSALRSEPDNNGHLLKNYNSSTDTVAMAGSTNIHDTEAIYGRISQL
ncbi:hypothetical protein EYF80_046546 [Liparis tanakae]|uniref:Uncharacterized protein n=1 Tax=Liparis tanakae TaxID=230148 RepID=A0A4Z2FQR8_9TELE|nr:hypothetical protein EYF80_046546 [Liparis tanakae]